ncbi:nucleotidyltransferase domain-containing protein, partial [Thermodesulfobacteriota bacterium]
MEEQIKQYFQREPNVAAVYLFGSRATNTNKLDSDVDLGILLKNFIQHECAALIEKVLVELSRKIRKDIHPVVLNTASEELLRQILSKGTILLV